VDGTLIEAWASMKSFKPKDGGGDPPGPGRNGERDFRGEKRSNQIRAASFLHEGLMDQVSARQIAWNNIGTNTYCQGHSLQSCAHHSYGTRCGPSPLLKFLAG
jgi:hypothetical protein